MALLARLRGQEENRMRVATPQDGPYGQGLWSARSRTGLCRVSSEVLCDAVSRWEEAKSWWKRSS